MSNLINDRAMRLVDLLNQNEFTKVAGGQTIEHISSPMAQGSFGKEQSRMRHTLSGVAADTEEAANTNSKSIPQLGQTQNLNTPGVRALAHSGTEVKKMPASYYPKKDLAKTAADYRAELVSVMRANGFNKTASSAYDYDEDTSATDVMCKFASLRSYSNDYEVEDCFDSLYKLASCNPVFNELRNEFLMNKLAEDVEALAAEAGVSPEDAAAALDEAAEADPGIIDDAEAEADADALEELTAAEAEADDLVSQAEVLAANASENLGVDVSPEDIMDACSEVERQAQEMGVSPAELIQAAAAQMEPADEEELAAADQLLEEGAAAGLSPEEVIEAVAGGDDEEGEIKEACYGVSDRVSRAISVLNSLY